MAYPPLPLGPRDDSSPATPNQHAQDHTDERNAINAVVAVLGPAPQGTAATVQDRLANVEDAAEGAWSAAAGAAGAAADAHARLDALENDDADVHEDVLVVDGETLASADVVFDRLRRSVVVDIDIEELKGPLAYVLDTPIVIDEGVNDTFGVNIPAEGPVTVTVPAGTYQTLDALVAATAYLPGAFTLSADFDTPEGPRRLAVYTGQAITFYEGNGGLAALGLSHLDGVEVDGWEYGPYLDGEMAAGDGVGTVRVAWIPGANDQFGQYGPVVPVIPYNPAFAVEAPPTALVSALLEPGRYQMVANGGVAGTVVFDAGGWGGNTAAKAKITVTGY